MHPTIILYSTTIYIYWDIYLKSSYQKQILQKCRCNLHYDPRCNKNYRNGTYIENKLQNVPYSNKNYNNGAYMEFFLSNLVYVLFCSATIFSLLFMVNLLEYENEKIRKRYNFLCYFDKRNCILSI